MTDLPQPLLAPIDPMLRELGRLVFNFNSTEHGLRRLAFLLIDPEDERIGEIAVDRLGSGGLEELVRALGEYRLGAKKDLVARVSAAVARFGALRQRRNEYVHAQWVIPNESTDAADISAINRKFRKGIRSQVASLDSRPVAEVASQASTLGEDLELLHAAVKAYLMPA